MLDLLFSVFLTAKPAPVSTNYVPDQLNLKVYNLPTVKKNDVLSLSAQSYLAVDVDSNATLLAYNENKPLPIASLTKLMTALLILENHQLDEVVKISSNVHQVEGSKVWLKTNEKITVENLLKGLLIKSGNDTAIALAEFHNGSVDKFVQAMNQRAKDLHLLNTHFQNPHGLDEIDHYSSASDLLTLLQKLWLYPVFKEIVAKKETVMLSLTEPKRILFNTNQLLSNEIKGVKTGTTDGAGECLILYIEKDYRKIFTVVLGSNHRYSDSTVFVNEIWQNIQW